MLFCSLKYAKSNDTLKTCTTTLNLKIRKVLIKKRKHTRAKNMYTYIKSSHIYDLFEECKIEMTWRTPVSLPVSISAIQTIVWIQKDFRSPFKGLVTRPAQNSAAHEVAHKTSYIYLQHAHTQCKMQHYDIRLRYTHYNFYMTYRYHSVKKKNPNCSAMQTKLAIRV